MCITWLENPTKALSRKTFVIKQSPELFSPRMKQRLKLKLLPRSTRKIDTDEIRFEYSASRLV